MNKVILYSQPSCGPCKMVKVVLNNKNISYDVCEDIEEMTKLGITQTPTLKINNKLIVGAKDIIGYLNK